MKKALKEMILQNQVTNMSLNRINAENAEFRLNPAANSVRFIYRHIGETMNMFGYFFGIETGVPNTTMGHQDTGQGKNLNESKKLIDQGFEMLNRLVDESTDDYWSEDVETPFFGSVSRMRLFSHILYHNSHHAGQISLTLSRGQK